MSNLDIIRAWKDEDFRRSLSEKERAQLPGHPSGTIEVQERDFSEGLMTPTYHGRKCTATR